MEITDWFDIHNAEHIIAYKHMRDTGMWPEDFIPKGMKFTTRWQFTIMSEMAEEWLKEQLGKLQ